MSLLVQRSVVESLKFNGKNIRAVHVKGEEFLVSYQEMFTKQLDATRKLVKFLASKASKN